MARAMLNSLMLKFNTISYTLASGFWKRCALCNDDFIKLWTIRVLFLERDLLTLSILFDPE
jgi:hypothetical protein